MSDHSPTVSGQAAAVNIPESPETRPRIPTFAAASFHQPSDSGHVAKFLQMLKSETTAHGKSANINFSMLSSNIKDAELLQNFAKCFLFSA